MPLRKRGIPVFGYFVKSRGGSILMLRLYFTKYKNVFIAIDTSSVKTIWKIYPNFARVTRISESHLDA